MRTFACLFFLGFCYAVAAQQPCATTAYSIAKKYIPNSILPAAPKTLQPTVKKTISLPTGIPGTAPTLLKSNVIQIPVVVHVLYNTAVQNISDAQIRSGIDALNRDFRRQNRDTVNTPERFKKLAADVEIEFRLATADPNGMATNGIIRKQTAVPAFNMDDKIKFTTLGGDDAWDSDSYLNIWLGNTRRLLGYATMPGGDKAVDGLVISCTAFGTLNAAGPYNMGRTTVHETGHWLGLQHLWGDEACGDDSVADTPKQGGYTSGCPTTFRTSCANGQLGDMYMNYMDFTNDACMNLFTTGQKDRMRSLFEKGGQRHALLASNGLKEPWMETIPVAPEDKVVQTFRLVVFPNPAMQTVSVQVETIPETDITGFLNLIQVNGMHVQRITINARTHKLQLNHLKPGVYFLQGVINNKSFSQKLVKL